MTNIAIASVAFVTLAEAQWRARGWDRWASQDLNNEDEEGEEEQMPRWQRGGRGWDRWGRQDLSSGENEEGEEDQMPRWQRGNGRQWSWADMRDRLQERWGQQSDMDEEEGEVMMDEEEGEFMMDEEDPLDEEVDILDDPINSLDMTYDELGASVLNFDEPVVQPDLEEEEEEMQPDWRGFRGFGGRRGGWGRRDQGWGGDRLGSSERGDLRLRQRL